MSLFSTLICLRAVMDCRVKVFLTSTMNRSSSRRLVSSSLSSVNGPTSVSRINRKIRKRTLENAIRVRIWICHIISQRSRYMKNIERLSREFAASATLSNISRARARTLLVSSKDLIRIRDSRKEDKAIHLAEDTVTRMASLPSLSRETACSISLKRLWRSSKIQVSNEGLVITE